MVATRRAAPRRAPIAGDQLLADLAELLALATIEIVSDNGVFLTVRPKDTRRFNWERHDFTGERLDDAVAAALDVLR